MFEAAQDLGDAVQEHQPLALLGREESSGRRSGPSAVRR